MSIFHTSFEIISNIYRMNKKKLEYVNILTSHSKNYKIIEITTAIEIK